MSRVYTVTVNELRHPDAQETELGQLGREEFEGSGGDDGAILGGLVKLNDPRFRVETVRLVLEGHPAPGRVVAAEVLGEFLRELTDDGAELFPVRARPERRLAAHGLALGSIGSITALSV